MVAYIVACGMIDFAGNFNCPFLDQFLIKNFSFRVNLIEKMYNAFNLLI
jgi:hypothetical protein